MAIEKTVQVESVELLGGDRVRVKLRTFYKNGNVTQETGPEYIGLDPAKAAHQPLISACRSAWKAAEAAFNQ